MNSSDQKGFSLFEIILVVLLLGIITSLAVPNFQRRYHQMQLKQTVEDIAYLMRYAQVRAIAQNRQHQLNFDSLQTHFWLTVVKDPNNEEEGSHRLSNRLAKTFTIPTEVQLQIFEEGPITFYTDGKIDKVGIELCVKETCHIISTKERPGYVLIQKQN